jgi:protein-tyrosine phosphatase
MSVDVQRVLMVCSGNICRSPMAEAIFHKFLVERDLLDKFEVDSAGTGRWHVGESPDKRAAQVLREHGCLVPKGARQFTLRDFEYFDYIMAMDRSVMKTLLRRAPPGARANVSLALDSTIGGDLPDPYFGRVEGFEQVYELLESALDRWLILLTARVAHDVAER